MDIIKTFRTTGLSLICLLLAIQLSGQCTLTLSSGVKPACQGSSNGEIRFQMNSGAPPFRVFLNNSTNPDFVSGLNQFSFVVGGLAPGTYSVRIFDAKNCAYSSNSIVIGNNSLPNISIVSNGQICSGAPFTIAASVGQQSPEPYSFSWNNGVAEASFTDAISSTKKYAVTVVDGNGCKNFKEALFTPLPSPKVAMPATIQSCRGEVVAIAPTVSEGSPPYAYKWSNSANSPTIQVSPDAATVYTLTVTDDKGCIARGNTKVDPSRVLAVSLGEDVLLCANQTLTLTPTVGNNAGGLEYSWDTGAKTASIAVAGATSRRYAVTVSDGAGCVGAASRFVESRELPVINLPPRVDDCQGNTVVLNPAMDPAKGPYSYRWSNGATSASLSVQLNTSQSIGLMVTENNSKCTSEAFVALTALPKPTVALPGNLNTCSNRPLLIAASVTGGTPPYSYAWSTGDAGGTIERSFLQGQSVMVTVTDAKGCTHSANGFVNVYSAPSIALVPQTITCPGQTVTLSPVVSGGTGSYRYAWSTGSTATTLSAAPQTLTSYSLTVTDGNGCITSANAVINPSRTISVALPAQLTVCKGETVTLSPVVTGGSGTLEFLWGDGQKTASLTLIAATSGMYSVAVRDQNACSGVAATAISVNNAPVIGLPDQVAVCLGDALTLSPVLDTINAPYSFNWSTGQISPSVTLRPTAPGNIQLFVRDKNGCSSRKTIAVEPLSLPDISLPDSILTCPNIALNLTGNTVGGSLPYSFLWSNGATGSSTTRIFGQQETLFVKVRDANGCVDSTGTLVVLWSPPSFFLPAEATVCKNSVLNLKPEGLSGQAPLLFSWSNGAVTPQIAVLGTGNQILRLSVTDRNGCSSTDTVVVKTIGIEEVTLTKDTAVCRGDSLLLRPLIQTGQYTYLWSNGSREPVLRVKPPNNMQYALYLENLAGCRDTLYSRVEVLPPPQASLTDSFRICMGDSLLLSPGVSEQTLRYMWENGALTPSRHIRVLRSAEYALTLTDVNGCKTRLSTVVQALPLPVVQLPEILSACNGEVVKIQPQIDAQNGIASVQWSNGIRERIINIIAQDSVLLIVRVQDVLGCQGADSLHIRPLPRPEIQLPEQLTACIGERVRIAPRSAAGVSYTTRWSTGVIAPFIDILSEKTSSYQAIASNDYGCEDTASTLLVAQPLPEVAIEGDRTFCASGAGQLQAKVLNSNPAVQYLWSTGSKAVTSPVDTANNEGTVFLRVTDEFGCVGEDSVSVTALPSPGIQVPESIAICENQSRVVGPLVTGGLKPYRYRWSSGESSATAVLRAGTYEFEVSDANGCKGNAQIHLAGQQAPEVTVTLLNRPGCNKPDGVVELSVRSAAEPVRILWSNGASGTKQQGLYPGVYQVAATDSLNCLSELTIQLLCTCTAKTGKMDLRPVNFCRTEVKSGIYDPSTEAIPPGMKRWFVLHNNAGVTLGNIILATDSLPVLRYQPGMAVGNTYYLSAIVTSPDGQGKPNLGDPCLAVSMGTPVILLPTPEKPALLTVADTAVCPGSSILISTNRQEPGYSYLWSTPRGEFTTGTPALTVANFSRADIGSYFVAVQNQGCISPQLGPLRLGIAREVDEVFAAPDQVVCGADTAILQANAPNGSQGRWLTSSPAKILAPEQEYTTARGLVPGSNLFIWTVITRNCIIQDSVEIYFVPVPRLEGDTFLLEEENNAAFFDMLKNDNLREIPPSFLQVSVLSKPAKGNLQVDASGNITYIRDNSIGADQEYTFTYRVCNTDPRGNCPDRCDEADVLLKISYNPRTLIYPALGLRPGYNNPTWQFEAARPMFSARLNIVDRWGQAVYRESYAEIQKGEIIKSWNGLRGNTLLPPGAYYFALEGIIENNEKVVQTGILYLLK